MSRFVLLLLSCTVLLMPFGATAQVWSEYPLYIDQQNMSPLPISGGGPVETLDWGESLNTNQSVVNLPFPVTFDGTVYDQIVVASDGYAIFGSTGTSTAANKMVPHTDEPNNAVLLFHDDLVLDHGPRTQVVGAVGARRFVVEWAGKRVDTNFIFRMQLWLTENSPVIRVHYGARAMGATSSTSVSASMGLENSTGTLGTPALQPDGRTNCNPPTATSASTTGCSHTGFPSHHVYQYGVPEGPDLIPKVSFVNVTETNGAIRIPINIRIENRGRTEATGVVWRYYLAPADRTGSVFPIELTHVDEETIPAMGTPTFTDIRTVTDVPTGLYRVCAIVDPDATTDDVYPWNNTHCSEGTLAIGPDFEAESVALAGATSARVGDLVTIRYKIKNVGLGASEHFSYAVGFQERSAGRSRDEDATGKAQILFEGSHPGLATGASYENTVQVRVPPNIPVEVLFPFVEANQDGGAKEVSPDTNRLSSTGGLTVVRPDLYVGKFTAEGECFFGRELEISYESCNKGAATAYGFGEAVFLHEPRIASNDVANMTMVDAMPNNCASDADCTVLGQGVCMTESLGGDPIGVCQYGCVSDADCGGQQGMTCQPDFYLAGRKTCQNTLSVNQCIRHTRTVVIPSVDGNGQPLQADFNYTMTALLDYTEKTNEQKDNNFQRLNGVLFCRKPAPDFHAAALVQPSRMAAGETITLHRRIENLGNESAGIAYRYVLSSNDIPSYADIQLPLVSTGGDGWVELEPGGVSSRTDVVSIPSFVKPQQYHLALIVDPFRTLHELDKTNNALDVGLVTVEPSMLRIHNVVLPQGTVGQRFNHQLYATGGTEEYVWSAKDLPPFLTLTERGVLESSRLRDDKTYTFTVKVTSGSVSAEAPVLLEVGMPKGPLTLETRELPNAFTQSPSPYFAALAIAGGVPPYTCEYDELPNRFQPDVNHENENDNDSCAIVANSFLEREGAWTIKVTVTDARNTKVRGDVRLEVVRSSTFSFSDLKFFDAYVGESYRGCIKAGNSRHAGTSRESEVTYRWAMDDLPPGLQLDPASTSREGCVIGEPHVCGSFLVKARVETRVGDDPTVDEWAESLAPLEVYCREFVVDFDPIPVLKRGDSVDVQLRTVPETPDVTFHLVAGVLPEGITVDSSGRIQGTIGQQVPFGSHTVIIEARDGTGTKVARGVAFVVQPVRDKEPDTRKKTSDCSAGGGGPVGAWSFGLVALGLVAVRRRQQGA